MKFKLILLVVLAVVGGTATGLVAAYRWAGPPVPAQGLEQELFAGGKRRQQQHQGTPRVRVEGARHDFGEREMSFSGNHVLVIHNDGDGLLQAVVRTIEGECRIRRMAGDSLIPPGGSQKVVISWRPPSEPGKVTVRLEVQTNDPQRPKIPVLITGKVRGMIQTKPYSLYFRLRPGQTASQTVKIKAPGFQQLPIAQVNVVGSSAKSCFQAKLLSPQKGSFEEEGGSSVLVHEIQVDAVSANPPGTYTGRLEVFVPEKETPVVVVPLKLDVLETFHVLGAPRGGLHNGFLLGQASQRQGKTFHLTVIGYGQDAGKSRLQVQEVFPQFLRVDVGIPEKIPNKESWRWTLKVQVPPGAPLGSFPANLSSPGGRIVLKTCHAGQPTRDLPLSFTVVP